MDKIAIIGAGLIGRAWAIVFARAGHPVSIFDDDPEALVRCLASLASNVADLARAGLVTEPPGAIVARVSVADSLASAIGDAVLVQENIRESLEAKIGMFASLDRLASPGAILASSTSMIPASRFTEPLAGRARCLVAHPVNPPYLVPLVELCPAPWTAPATVERARALYAGAGQVPITLRRELPGFLLNRVQGAVLNEVMRLYEQGYASADDLDHLLKDGLALRWSFMGPFETIDLNAPGGLADYAARYGAVYGEISAASRPFDWSSPAVAALHAERRERLPAGKIPERSDWRDRRLMALLAHKRVQPDN